VYVNYELDVEPLSAIESGEPIHVSLGGRAQIGADVLNLGQVTLGEVLNIPGFRRIALEKFQATVQVRRGAEGKDVVLKPSLDEHWACTYDGNGKKDPEALGPFPPCSPENDQDDGANDDCIGLGDAPDRENRCLAYFDVSTDNDCSENGVCFDLGHTGPDSPCEANDFCVTDNVTIPLEPLDSFYTAEGSGSVLFGWAEPDQGEDLLEAGPNRGAYDPERVRLDYRDEPGPNGMRMLIGGVELAFECPMGVNSRGPDGVPTIDPLLSPSSDGILISCPIQEPD